MDHEINCPLSLCSMMHKFEEAYQMTRFALLEPGEYVINIYILKYHIHPKNL